MGLTSSPLGCAPWRDGHSNTIYGKDITETSLSCLSRLNQVPDNIENNLNVGMKAGWTHCLRLVATFILRVRQDLPHEGLGNEALQIATPLFLIL